MKTLITAIILVSCPMTLGDVVEPAKDPPLAPVEVKFLKEAGQSSVNTLKVATLGSQKCQNPTLRQLASSLVADHKTALEKARPFVERRHLSLPTIIDEETALVYKKLDQEAGLEFDSAFVGYLDKVHIKVLRSFEKAQKECQDAELRAWIEETALVIKAHYERLKKLK